MNIYFSSPNEVYLIVFIIQLNLNELLFYGLANFYFVFNLKL